MEQLGINPDEILEEEEKRQTIFILSARMSVCLLIR
jgi:hypothetical protein